MGIGQVAINNLIFVSAIAGMKSASASIDDSSILIESRGENSKVFELYKQDLVKLEVIMNIYKQLINKDIAALEKVERTMTAMDLKINLLWK